MGRVADRTALCRAERQRLSVPLRVVLLATASVAAFCLVQSLLALRQQSIEIETITRLSGPAAATQGVESIVPEMVLSGARYLALLVMGVALLLRGWRRAYIVPIAMIAFLTPASGGLPLLRHTIGTWPGLGSWLGLSSEQTLIALWVAGFIDLMMVLASARIIATGGELAQDPPRHRPIPTKGIGVGAGMLVVASLSIADAGTGLSAADLLLRLGPLFLLGCLLRIDRYTVPAMLAAALLLSFDLGNSPPAGTVLHALPLFAAAIVGASAGWLDRSLDRIGDSTWGLLVAVNLLNVMDIVLTRVSIARVGASELNPLVLRIGFSVKLGVVAVASLLVARLRPRLLIVALVAFSLLTVWQAAGLISSAGVLGS